MTIEYLIGESEAQDQLDKFCEWYGIDLDENLTLAAGEGMVAMEVAMKRIIKAIRQGSLEIVEADHPKYGTTLQVLQRLAHSIGERNISEITYHELTGATKASVKIGKNANETEALFALLGVLSKKPKEVFRGLRGRDLGVANLVGLLFLMA